jgi:transposase InsO family protein
VAGIREVHGGHKETHGARRVHAELRGFGHTVNRERATRLMREHGIAGRRPRRRRRTAVPDPLAPPAPDLTGRDLTAVALDERWCGDITCIQVGGSRLCPASVIGMCSRRVVGRSMAPHMRAGLVADAPEAAVAARGGDVTGVVFHSDRGSQYTSAAFAEVCDRHGVRRSTGRVGPSHDNAPAGSLRQGLKREATHRKLSLTMSQAKLETFQRPTYCNARRRHSPLARLSPLEFEQQHHAQAKLPPAA